ncbi:hypothetical protein J5N97_026439 [Dioscorea zingiberensis]|uniref:Uncharacterized protein n=1 Tax=Dioscorea zingiberensis TaxID=325984 RepID=A0A9D5C231_9LILI|nr:hypothetical protein J5N97_026439 [Dioscorea zingiberensis]
MNGDHHQVSSPLRIIHAGGLVEQYYMAIPASEIMRKYPKAVLARPEVFHKPWDSLVGPNEILSLGEKLYIIPRHTVLKLQRRIQRSCDHKTECNSCTTTHCMLPKNSEGVRKFELSRIETADKMKAVQFGKRRRVRMVAMWQPSLTVIDEASPLAQCSSDSPEIWTDE